MIQRIQSLYLLAAVVLLIVSTCFTLNMLPLAAVSLLMVIMGGYSIFLYNNRKLQMRFCVFNSLLVVCWYIVFYVLLKLSTETDHPTTLWVAVFLPAVAEVFFLLARRAIKKDDDLVRSADRIR